MKNQNILIKLLKAIGMIILSTLLWIVIMSFVTPEQEEIIEPFPGFILLAGIVTSLCIYLVGQYNHIRRVEQAVKASKSHILIIEERNHSLLDKANRLIDKHQKLEKDTILDIGKSNTKVHYVEEKTVMKSSKIETSEEFGQFLKTMPELVANRNVERLLNEIFETENNLAQWKIAYNNQVEEYNASIHLFPISLITKLVRLKELEFYSGIATDDITDDMLGL